MSDGSMVVDGSTVVGCERRRLLAGNGGSVEKRWCLVVGLGFGIKKRKTSN